MGAMFFFHPVRRARRAVQPRAYRKVRHPVRSAAWTASGVGRKRPPRRHSAPKRQTKQPSAWAEPTEAQLEQARRAYASGERPQNILLTLLKP